MKLYCVKSITPHTTKGKVYELHGDMEYGSITFDNGWTDTCFAYHKSFWSSDTKATDVFTPLISRPAKVGESIYPTKDSEFGRYKKGDILRVTTDDTTMCKTWKGYGVGYHHEHGDFYVIRNSEYLVLDGYSEDERKVDMFTKDDLKTGDLVVYRGENHIVADEYDGEVCLIDKRGYFLYGAQIQDDLIEAVYRKDMFSAMRVLLGRDRPEEFMAKVFDKAEQITEMTMEEINAALGKTIKVIEKH